MPPKAQRARSAIQQHLYISHLIHELEYILFFLSAEQGNSQALTIDKFDCRNPKSTPQTSKSII